MNEYIAVKKEYILKIRELLEIIINEAISNEYIIIKEDVYNKLLSKIHELSSTNDDNFLTF